ncbi:MAG: hypothetical protein LAP38_10375 [Acidobacteriia bacterium]|nr:hypothetical protein [Terriglobia bacterium]
MILQRASEFGVSPNAVRQAIEDWVQHRADSTAYDRGLAAFYRQDFGLAVNEWENSVALKEADLAQTYVLLGTAELVQRNLSEAGSWIHKAFRLNPNDISTLIGMASLCALLPDQDQQEISEKTSFECRQDPTTYVDDALVQARLEMPRSFVGEAFFLLFRLALLGLVSDFDETAGESKLQEIAAQVRELAEESQAAGPAEEAILFVFLGDCLLAQDDYAGAQRAFDRASMLAKSSPLLRNVTAVMIELPLGDSYSDRDMVPKALETYNAALDSARRLESSDVSLARKFECKIHLRMADAYLHVPKSSTNEPAPKNDIELKGWYREMARGLFKHIDSQRQTAFRQECRFAIAIADRLQSAQQRIEARLVCGNSFLDLDQVNPARQYYAEAITLAKQTYPATWREFVNLNHWTNVVGVLSAGDELHKAVPIATAMWDLTRRMEYALDFPPPKNAHPSYVSAKSFTWLTIDSQLEQIAKLDPSPGIVQARNEALAIRCYDAVTKIISADPESPQKSQLEDFDRHLALSLCSSAVEANPTGPEGYILRGFVYFAQAKAILARASGPWTFLKMPPSTAAEMDFNRAATLPDRIDGMLKESTHEIAGRLLNEIRLYYLGEAPL